MSSLLTRELVVPRWLRSPRNWAIAIVVALVGTMAWTIPAWVADQQELVRKDRDAELALLQRHAARHQEIVKRLWATPFFTRELQGDDASGLLNPALPWDQPPPDFNEVKDLRAFLRQGPRPSDEALSLPRELDRAFSQPWDAGIPSELLQLDVSWMDGLDAFGTWNLYEDSPALETHDFIVRLPSFLTLDKWGRAALAQGLVNEELETASRRLRALAWLELTTGNEPGVASGLSLISREQRLLSGHAGFSPIEPASADDAEKAVAFERSLEVYCPEGCGALARTPLPPVLECATRNSAAWDLSMKRWFNGLDAPPIRTLEGCHFEDVRFLQEWHAKNPTGAGPLPSVSLATISFGLPSRSALGGMLARVFLPSLVIRYRHDPISTRSAGRTLERAAR